jgi:hypothetical protein
VSGVDKVTTFRSRDFAFPWHRQRGRGKTTVKRQSKKAIKQALQKAAGQGIKPSNKKADPMEQVMDDELKEITAGMTPGERIEMGERMMEWVNQLNDYKPAHIRAVAAVKLTLRPQQVAALLAISEIFPSESEPVHTDGKIRCAAECILDHALMMLPEISNLIKKLIKYRIAEDLEWSNLVEMQTARSLARWLEQEDCDDDGYRDSYGYNKGED